MSKLLKNWLLLNNSLYQMKFWLLICFCYSLPSFSQIANFVRNGGFEDKYNCNYPNYLSKAKGWAGIGNDTAKFGGFLYAVNCYSNAPANLPGYQYPRSGDTYYRQTNFCLNPCTYTSSRYYAKNRLKSNLQNGKIYCVKMFVSLQNTSPYATSNFDFYFSDNDIDTIYYSNLPLSYLTPQVKNPVSNIVTDTLNWVPITGTFKADGTEKYLVIGNFESNSNSTKKFVGSDSTYIWSEYLIDDVSCIAIDLPAFAGNDTSCVLGGSVYIGRARDVGIDEACTWFKLPNTTVAIDTAAGIFVSPIVTTTYMVRQEICGNVKWDTVVVYPSAVGLEELKILNEELRIYPVPADQILEISIERADLFEDFKSLSIYNHLGQLVREEEVTFKEKIVRISIGDLKQGLYQLKIKGGNLRSVSKRFVVAR